MNSPIALHVDWWYPLWVKRWCELFHGYRAGGMNVIASYDLANAVMMQPLRTRTTHTRPLHDMELAQMDVDVHGIRYATPWAGEDEGEVE